MPPRVRALVLASLLLVCSAGAAHAATFTVTTGNDRVDTAPGDGLCIAQGLTAACTLRAAVEEANVLPGPDTIVLPAGSYGLANTGSDEDAAATGDLDITSTMTIAGAGAAVTEIQQVTFDRLFDVRPGGSLTLTDVHLDFGFLADVVSSGGGNGAGIRSQGTLIVRRAWFSDMHATIDVTRDGGGVAIDGGAGSVTDSLFTDLQVENGAGQAASVTSGSLSLQNVTATGNGLANGGVFAALGSGTLTVRGATVARERRHGGRCHGRRHRDGVFHARRRPRRGRPVRDGNRVDGHARSRQRVRPRRRRAASWATRRSYVAPNLEGERGASVARRVATARARAARRQPGDRHRCPVRDPHRRRPRRPPAAGPAPATPARSRSARSPT